MRTKLLILTLLTLLISCAPTEPPAEVSIPFAWAYRAGDYVRGKPVARDGVVYVGADDNALHAVDAATGEPIWAVRDGGQCHVSAGCWGRNGILWLLGR